MNARLNGFRRGVAGTLAVLGFYGALIGSLLPKFRGRLSITFSRVKQSSWTAPPLKMGRIGYAETSLNTYQPKRRINPEAWSPPVFICKTPQRYNNQDWSISTVQRAFNFRLRMLSGVKSNKL